LGISETHVIEHSPRLMPRQVDSTGSIVLQRKLQELGLTIHLNKNTTSIEGSRHIETLMFQDGTYLPTDILIISAGIRPRDELARQAGLETGTRGGIVVNDYMQASDPSIFAIGECALHKGMIYGLAAPGYEMAEV